LINNSNCWYQQLIIDIGNLWSNSIIRIFDINNLNSQLHNSNCRYQQWTLFVNIDNSKCWYQQLVLLQLEMYIGLHWWYRQLELSLSLKPIFDTHNWYFYVHVLLMSTIGICYINNVRTLLISTIINNSIVHIKNAIVDIDISDSNTKFWTIDFDGKIKRIATFGCDGFQGSISPCGWNIHFFSSHSFVSFSCLVNQPTYQNSQRSWI